jgi:hypothetical protein
MFLGSAKKGRFFVPARRREIRPRFRAKSKSRRPKKANLTTTFLPATGDRPGSGSIGSVMAGVAFLKVALF